MVDCCIDGTIILDTYQKLKSVLLEKGVKFDTERGECIELLNVHSCIRMPQVRGVHPYWYGEKLEDYIDQFFKANIQGFKYTYGDRIINYGNSVSINQLEYIIMMLKKNRNTRRAIIGLYDPEKDLHEEDIPCLNHLQYQIRGTTLLTTVLYRSHDIDAYYPNLCGISELSGYIATELGCYDGEINVYSNNLHKYVTEL